MSLMKFIRNLSGLAQFCSIIIGLLLASPLTGFFHGILECKGCGMNPVHYLFSGIIEALFATIEWKNLRHIRNIGWLPFIPVAALLGYLMNVLFLYWISKIKTIRNQESSQYTDRTPKAP